MHCVTPPQADGSRLKQNQWSARKETYGSRSRIQAQEFHLRIFPLSSTVSGVATDRAVTESTAGWDWQLQSNWCRPIGGKFLFRVMACRAKGQYLLLNCPDEFLHVV